MHRFITKTIKHITTVQQFKNKKPLENIITVIPVTDILTQTKNNVIMPKTLKIKQ